MMMTRMAANKKNLRLVSARRAVLPVERLLLIRLLFLYILASMAAVTANHGRPSCFVAVALVPSFVLRSAPPRSLGRRPAGGGSRMPVPTLVATRASLRSSSRDDDDEEQKENEPPHRRDVPSRDACSREYAVGQALFGGTGLVLLLMPDRTLTTLLAAKWGGAAGYLVASGLCRILRRANRQDRLSSDTYKRLNVGLMGFFLAGSFAIPGEAAFLPGPAAAAVALAGIVAAVRAYGFVAAYRGWKRGVMLSASDAISSPDAGTAWTFTRAVRELAAGTKETMVGLKVQSNKKALTYRNCLLLVGLGIFSAFMEGLFNIEVS
jgi:hypothetical protein